MALKIWKVKELDKENALNIAQMFNIPAFVAMLLDIYNVDDVEDYIGLNFEKILDFDFVDIKKAVQRIKVAIDQGEQICICGDYDADGVTSVALLYLYLCSLGANVSYHIPVRNRDGYGLNIQTIDFLSSNGIELIITVDNGVTAVEEIKYAKELGIDTLVTDHHKLPAVLPEAVAIVDLQREGDGKFKELAGVGVVFKLIMALEGEDLDLEFLFENYADLVLIGTIADIVPLVDENRLFSKIGLSYINKTDKIGIISLLKTAGLLKSTLNSTDIAFGLVPRINAAGRLSTTEKVVELLTTDDEARALEIAQMLENENIQRKNLEQKALMQIEALLKKEPERLCEDLLIVNGEDWHPGVIGIVASKLLEKYGKPTIVITKTGNIARGSARSIEGFSIYDAINSCSEYLLKFGGHTMAAGFDIKTEDIARLKEDIKAFTRAHPVPFYSLDITCKLNPEMLSLELVKQIDILEPFGKDNPKPIFGLYNMKLESISPVGERKHLRMTFSRGEKLFTAISFFTNVDEFPYKTGDMLDLAIEVGKSVYQGIESLSIVVRDIKLSSVDNEDLMRSLKIYEKIRRNEKENIDLSRFTPTREDFANVYRHLKSLYNKEEIIIRVDVLSSRLNSKTMNLCKLLLILDVLSELDLLNIEKDYLTYRVKLHTIEKKVELGSSEILKSLG